MTPQYPYPYQPVYRQRRHSFVDITITSILCAVVGVAALGTVGFSMFFAMTTDSCGDRCSYSALTVAYLVTWGGVAVAVIVAALALIVVALVTGGLLANSVMHHG